MRASEFLTEDDGQDSNDSSTSRGTPNKKSGELDQNHKSSIKGMDTYPGIPSHYYDMYRFGVHMAGSPDNQSMSKTGPTANQMVTLAYSDADADIINNSRKAMKISGKTVTSRDSKESPDINKTSAVAKPKKNRYGV